MYGIPFTIEKETDFPFNVGTVKPSVTTSAFASKSNTWYNNIFDNSKRRTNPSEVPLPYAKELDAQARLEFLAPLRHDLPLSIVTVTRNDDHVEQMRERTQAFINSVEFLSRKYETNIELIIVEWNPPSGRLRMREAFAYPITSPFIDYNIVTVPNSVHNSYKYSQNLPLYQMIAKNVGIRRSRGKFVLATNIDILLSEKLFVAITHPQLEHGKIYRSNRWDIDRKVLEISEPEQQLLACPSMLLQTNYPSGTVKPSDQVPDTTDSRISWFPDLHTWACGDFQLMHREDWAKIGGYSEIDAYSYHIDSLFALTCYHAGFIEHRFDNTLAHYHIDHTLGIQVNASEYTINENKTIKHLSLGDLLNLHLSMHNKKDYLLFNHDDWGLADHELPQHHISQEGNNIVGVGTAPQTSYSGTDTGSRISLDDIHIDSESMSKNWLKSALSFSAAYLKTYHEGKDLYFWGTGKRAQALSKLLTEFDLKISGFLGDPTEASKVDGELVILPDEIINTDKPAEHQALILISSMFADQIALRLNGYGKKEGNDYIVLY